MSGRKLLVDFSSVLTELRLLYNANPPDKDPNASIAVGKSLRLVEKEIAIQSIEILFGHLMQYEQAREAITLMAFALPHDVRKDPRIRTLMAEAIKLGETMRTPLAELATGYASLIHAIEDDLMKSVEQLPSRARYMLSVARLSRAKTAMEFGTGCGSNVFHCAILAPDIEWIGVDVSEQQILYLKDQAVRVGVPNVKFLSMRERMELGVEADCVGLLDAMEHTVFGDELLDAAEDAVADGGVLCITVPLGPWSLWSLNRTGAVAGSHVAVEDLSTLCTKAEIRGKVLDARVIPGATVEMNANSALTYEPWPWIEV